MLTRSQREKNTGLSSSNKSMTMCVPLLSGQESLHLYRELNDQRGVALALHRLARIASSRGDASAAISLYEASLVISRTIGDRVQQGLSQTALTSLRFADATTYPPMYSLLEESLALLTAEHYQGGMAWSLYGLGLWHFQQAEIKAARSLFEESLALFKASRQRQYIATCTCSWARHWRDRETSRRPIPRIGKA
jgi:tetratricopeptide (TPR) repeat protein